MRIVIDARYLSSEISGIGNYSRNLIEHLSLLDALSEYRVLVHSSFNGPLRMGPNFDRVKIDARPLSAGTLFSVGSKIRSLKPDLFHALCPVTPAFYREPMIATVHDLQPLMMPEWSGGRARPVQWGYQRFYHWMYPSTFARAAKLLCVSETTCRILGERYPQFASKAVAIPSGFTPDPPPASAEGLWQKLRAEHNIPDRFVIYVGSTRPNKNLDRMVQAFARLRERNASMSDVAFVLALTPDRFLEKIEQTIDACGVRSNIRILRHVDTDARNVLLAHARLLFFVTRLEGFGFPILEAQAMGTPVLASTSDASPEVAGAGALLADWVDVEQQSHALERLLIDETLRLRLIAEGNKNLSRFRWEETARKTLELYAEAARERDDEINKNKIRQ